MGQDEVGPACARGVGGPAHVQHVGVGEVGPEEDLREEQALGEVGDRVAVDAGGQLPHPCGSAIATADLEDAAMSLRYDNDVSA